MNEEKQPQKRFYFMKKIKYGSVAIVFTAAFIALVFIANVVTTAIHMKSPMIIDMTKKQVYSISDQTRDLLKDVTAPVEIIFLMDIDLYAKTSGGAMVVNFVKEYPKEFSNITIRSVDLIKNPRVKNEFTASDASQLKTTSVVVKSGSTSRILTQQAFYTIAESTGSAFGFAGEKVMTASIMQVTRNDSPLIYFSTGHSESVPTELVKILELEGCTVKQIDLTQENIDPSAKAVIIYNPQKDFLGAKNETDKSEVDKLANFLNAFGSVMYFTNPESAEFPEIEALLKEYGISFMHDTVVVDLKNAVDTYGMAINSQYVTANNVGDQLTESIRNLPSLPKTIVHDVKPIKILDLVSADTVSSVLRSYPSSYLVKRDAEDKPAGEYDLLVVAQKTRYVENFAKTALVLACGSTDFLAPEILGSNAYANSDIILNALRIMTNRKVATDIEFKPFDDNALDMTLEQSNGWTLACILIMPALAVIIGFAVWMRRRHS